MNQSWGKLRACLLTGLVLALVLPGWTQGQQSAQEEADGYFQSQQWEQAAVAYEQIVAAEPDNGQAWFRLGLARHNLKQYEGAIAAFEQADRLQFVPGIARYNIAAGYARLGRPEEALAWLGMAIEAGFNRAESMETDADMAGLRSDPRFEEYLQGARINAAPCEHQPVYREFDFWVGEWEVFVPSGQQAGTNVIEKLDRGCVLLESWRSVLGGSGHSINYYDAARKRWIQRWADSGGGVVDYEGEFRDGAMRMSGEHISRHGTKELARGAWTPLPDGNVRQLLERSRDGGKTWYVWFDGTYVRKR